LANGEGTQGAGRTSAPWTREDYILAFVTVVAVAAGAAVWLFVSAAVAFPKLVLTGSFGALFDEFFKSIYHPASVIFLLGTDIIIAILFLKEAKVSEAFQGRWLGLAALAITLYAVVTMALPAYNSTYVAAHTTLLGFFAYLLIGVPRALSYGAPKIAKAVNNPGG
jgi:hypothetical protein